MHVIPAKGLQVPDPERGGFLAAEGREVEQTQYWLRRLNDGDVTLASASQAKVAKAGGEQ
ncbi:DUF2635 domain-containing protein [Jeongeupia sp. USM3]|uniref:DUF2635 domain-containing protein n=1 Tax=Jeongeupia sp. USM3 TaxID=1906741 RepID=UPI00089DDCF1|nr:DUF2635 domain-containing protein [Jeongeupia sp. USM3]AOY00102.1 hypothetical protein BJP62_06340 [Jeongeupia sp. USM3]